jgi:hypothetical protein
MKPIEKEELYENLSQFLKTKGIEMKEGTYSKGVHAGCSLLADAINLSQTGLERAKEEIEKKFDQVRQVIHQKTAPKTAAKSPESGNPPAGARVNSSQPESQKSPRKKKRSKTQSRRSSGRKNS